MKVGSGLTVTLKEGQAIICYVASTVVDIQPNGVIVLEAHQSIIENNDLYAYKLTGKVDPNKVSTDGSVLSENIAELSISKHVFDIRKLIGSL